MGDGMGAAMGPAPDAASRAWSARDVRTMIPERSAPGCLAGIINEQPHHGRPGKSRSGRSPRSPHSLLLAGPVGPNGRAVRVRGARPERFPRRERQTNAIVVHEQGPPEVLSLEELPQPEPDAGEVLVRLEAVGVNFIDLNQRSGAYPAAVPFVPGSEGAGVVAELGPGVTGVGVGDRVTYATVPRAYAEYAVVPAHRLIPVPEGVSVEQAAAVTLQGMTAHYLVNSVCSLEDGDWCLVHAAAGGVGLLLTQLSKRRGLRVIATASTAAKAERATGAGADHVVIYTQDDFSAAVADLTEGRGVRAAFDAVGKTTFDNSLRSIGRRGHMVLFGQASGPVDPFDPRRLQQEGSLFITRPALADYISSRDELLWRGEEVLGLVDSGELDVQVFASFPLEKAADAHRALAGRGTTGKLILVP